MRLTRRSCLLLGGGTLALGAGGLAWADRPGVTDGPIRIEVRAYPLGRFAAGAGDERRLGVLEFRSGLELQADYDGFGGFSGLWRSPDGSELVAISDNAQWLTARIATAGPNLSGLTDFVMAPILGGDGRPLRRTSSYDTEALALAGATAYLGVERTQEVLRFNWAKDGVAGRAQPVPVPAGLREWPRNKGIEALGVAPTRSPLAGALVIVSERARWEEDRPTEGFILTGPRQGAFEVLRSDGYEITDLAFRPSGDMLILERRFTIFRGVAARIRRIGAEGIRPGALLDGPVLFEADAGYQIDNMEGLALHRNAAGETILTLISDNNFSVLQRTLLMEFALMED